MPHNKLFNLFCELIDFSFKPKKGAKWTKKDQESSVRFTKKLNKVQSFC